MITISKAKIKDTFDIVQLEQVIRKEKNVANIYETAAFIRDGFVFVAKDKNKIVGAIISFLSRRNMVFVTDFVVDPEYRNLGIGHKLYNKLMKEVKIPIQALVGVMYPQSIHLHESLGFKRIKKIDRPYGIEKYPMYLYELRRNDEPQMSCKGTER